MSLVGTRPPTVDEWDNWTEIVIWILTGFLRYPEK